MTTTKIPPHLESKITFQFTIRNVSQLSGEVFSPPFASSYGSDRFEYNRASSPLFWQLSFGVSATIGIWTKLENEDWMGSCSNLVNGRKIKVYIINTRACWTTLSLPSNDRVYQTNDIRIVWFTHAGSWFTSSNIFCPIQVNKKSPEYCYVRLIAIPNAHEKVIQTLAARRKHVTARLFLKASQSATQYLAQQRVSPHKLNRRVLDRSELDEFLERDIAISMAYK